MFELGITADYTARALEIVSTMNLGHRNRGFNGERYKQYISMLGQISVMDVLGVEPVEVDMGFDFILNGHTVDIKTMSRNVPMKSHYVHNLVGYQMNFHVDYYIFLSYNISINTIIVCGVISQGSFKDLAKYYPIGTRRVLTNNMVFETGAPLYEIEQRWLIPVYSPHDILSVIA